MENFAPPENGFPSRGKKRRLPCRREGRRGSHFSSWLTFLILEVEERDYEVAQVENGEDRQTGEGGRQIPHIQGPDQVHCRKENRAGERRKASPSRAPSGCSWCYRCLAEQGRSGRPAEGGREGWRRPAAFPIWPAVCKRLRGPPRAAEHVQSAILFPPAGKTTPSLSGLAFTAATSQTQALRVPAFPGTLRGC